MPIAITNPRLPDNPMVFVNTAFCDLTGYTRDELIGRDCRCLQGKQTDRASIARVRAAVRQHSALDIELRSYRKNGTAFWNRLHLVPVHAADGQLTYFFASLVDVTQERERLAMLQAQNAALLAATAAGAQADAANAEKSRLLAVASHDIRQPLQSMVLLQGALARSVQGQAAEKLVVRLGQTLESMSAMLNALLDPDQIEAGTARTDSAELRIGDRPHRVRDSLAGDMLDEGLALVPRGLSARSDGQPAAPTQPPAAAASGQSLAGTVVFVVDDNEQVREAIRAIIQTEAGTVNSFASAEAFLAAYRPGGRACLLIDAYLPGIGGIDLLRRLRAGGDALPAIMITGNSDVTMAVDAMKAGASDFIEKPVAAEELLASLLRTMDLCHDSARLAAWRQTANQHLASLSMRQRQVMALVLAGHPSKNIAADLGISQRTVENHRASIMRKAGTRSLPALARLALAADWDGADGPSHG